MAGKDHVATAGTLASAALVASCCLGPVLFLVFGTTVGVLGSLGALEPYRAYFIVTGFGFWGYGFYRLYLRPLSAAGGQACGPACERPSRTARALLWLGLAVLVLAVALPGLALYAAG